MAGTAPMAAYCHSPEGSAFRIAIPDVKYRISRSSPASLSQPFSLAYQMGNASNSSIHAVRTLVRGAEKAGALMARQSNRAIQQLKNFLRRIRFS